eukprot:UN05335
MDTSQSFGLVPIQLPPPLWKRNEIVAETKRIADKIRSTDIKHCQSFNESNQTYNNNTMRIISEPRLKRLQANNKLKSDRLARKAHLARVSRRKKAQKMEDLRAKNVSLKLEIEKLKKQNQILNRKRNNNHNSFKSEYEYENENENEYVLNEQEALTKPIWMNDILKSSSNMKQILQLNDNQISSISKTINPQIDLIEDNIKKSKLYIKRLKIK